MSVIFVHVRYLNMSIWVYNGNRFFFRGGPEKGGNVDYSNLLPPPRIIRMRYILYDPNPYFTLL